MLFLANPGGKKPRKRKRKTTARRVARRRTRRAKTTASKGGSMAVRRRRKRRSVSAAPRRRPVRRRRRRAVAVVHANPVRRRRRRAAVAGRRRSGARRYRRNPDTVRGIVGTIKQGVKDGALVLAGEVVQNKATALADKFVPQFGTGVAAQMARVGLVNLGVASAIAIGTRKFLPGYSRMVTAGAFSRGLANIIATTPAAPLLGDGVVYDEGMGDDYDGVGAYAQPAALGAYAPSLGAYPSAATVDVPHAEH